MALGLTPKEIIESGRHPLLECSKDWERIELNIIADVQNGYAFKSEFFNKKEGMPLIRIRDVGKKETEELYSGDYDDDYLVGLDDILIGMDGDFRAAYWKGKKGLLNQRVCRLRKISKKYSKKFLFYLLQPYLDAIHAETSAVTVKHLSSRTIQSIPLPNPPLQTQHRIVEKIEELFSELDNGVANLKKAQKQLKTYRQAVLKDAFEGKLTAAWREQQTDLPSPEELLQQIEAERKVHRERELAEWEEEVEQWEKDGKPGRKPAKPRKAKVPDPLIESEIIEFSDFPTEWMHVRPENISSPENYSIGIGPFGSNLKVADYRDSGVPLIFVRNITNENFGLNQKFIDEEKYEELKAHSVKPLDILVTKMGDPPGDCTIYPEGLPNAIITADCLKFRVAGNYIDRKFYRYCIESFLVKRQLGVMTKGVAQKKISAGRFKTLILPLPSLEEQNKIVQEIESRLSIVDQLEKTIEENLLKAEALRQSILKKAFNGELVEE